MSDVLLLSRYDRLGASSRIRSYQFLPALAAQGIEVTVCPLFDDAFLHARHAGRRLAWSHIASMYLGRIKDMLARRRESVLWVEYELLPWLPFAFERVLLAGGRPVVIDYDDAIFHRYDQHGSAIVRRMLGRKIDRLMHRATLVIAGNDYLASRARLAGASRVEIVPSVIDLAGYRQKADDGSAELVVGWIGSPSTVHYLRSLEPALRALAGMLPMRLVNVGGAAWTPSGFPVDNLAWSEATEVERMLQFDVGVMPLADDPWSRGKCGFKLIQYMGCALPVVASPVGANATIVEDGVTGFHATTSDEWTRALATLARSIPLRRAMGRAGFARLKKHYTLDVAAPKLARIFTDIIPGRRARS